MNANEFDLGSLGDNLIFLMNTTDLFNIWYILYQAVLGKGIVKGARWAVGLCRTGEVPAPCKERPLWQQLLPALFYHVDTLPIMACTAQDWSQLCECHVHHNQDVLEVYTEDQLLSHNRVPLSTLHGQEEQSKSFKS